MRGISQIGEPTQGLDTGTRACLRMLAIPAINKIATNKRRAKAFARERSLMKHNEQKRSNNCIDISQICGRTEQ